MSVSAPVCLVVCLLVLLPDTVLISARKNRPGRTTTTTTTTTPAALIDADKSLANRSGLLVTTSAVWVNGTTEQICFQPHQFYLSTSLLVNVTLHQTDNHSVIYNQTTLTLNSTEASKCVEVKSAFRKSVQEFNLNISAQSASGDVNYTFQQTSRIFVQHDSMSIFIETDKPIYKPSDTVRIRVLALNGPYLDIVTDNVTLLYIEDPSKTRIMQWKDLTNTDGLVEVELQLSDEPPLGQWTIKSTINEEQHERTFTVKEYVLPKFEVTLDTPTRISNETKEIKWKVCARYTYGEPVFGEVSVASLCLKRPFSYDQLPDQCHYINSTKLVDGCAAFNLNNSLFEHLRPTEHYRHYYHWVKKQFVFTAQVTESGTEVVLNGSHVEDVIIREVTIKADDDNLDYYKPGFEYIGKGTVTVSTEMSMECDIEVSTENWSTRVTSDSSGRFQFVIPAHVTWSARSTSLNVNAKKRDSPEERQFVLNYLKPWYSPSNNFIQLDMPRTPVACDSQLTLPVSVMMETGLDGSQYALFLQVMSRGDILDARSVTVTLQLNGSFTHLPEDRSLYFASLPVDITSRMSGAVVVIVFYVRSNGETIGDSQRIMLPFCTSNKVSMEFVEKRVQPGHKTRLRIAAAQNSLCAVAVVDKSIELMGSTTQLTAGKVEELVNSFGLWKHKKFPLTLNSFYRDCQKNDREPQHRFAEVYDRRRRMIAWHPWGGGYTSNYLDSKEAFKNAGLIVVSDLVIETRPCQRRMWRHYAMPMPMSSERFGAAPSSAAVDRAAPPPPEKPVLHRTFFPETWLWNLERIGESGQKEIPIEMPHTITEWVGNGFCLNKQSSIGVSPTFRVTAFQPFFISFTLPYSMVRGESVNIPVSVFNYLSSTCLTVTLTVELTEAFELVAPTNTTTAADSNSNIAQLRVCARSTETHVFRIIPRQIGKINFTVEASSTASAEETNSVEEIATATAQDKVTRPLLVLSEGKEEEYTRSAFICTENSTSGSWSLDLPDDVISDSVRTRINVIGDIMGPALSGLDQLLRLPMGCGEQNMLLFAPNIYVLEYLTNTQQLTPSLKEKALGFMRTGYQRELTYRHRDGSYSAFGESDPVGSIWLTSFVVRSFARAQPFIFIDGDDLVKSIGFIKANQLENGCFRSVGTVHHKDMQGGLQGESSAGLTAYILLSLLEANVSKTDESIRKALRCLSQQTVNDTYTLALLSYAYSLYGLDKAALDTVRGQLNARAVSEAGMRHWMAPAEPVSAETRSMWWYKPQTADVEMTSYILLGLLHTSTPSAASDLLPITRWLTTQRNAYGGFSSTQDTVVALQALSQFASMVFSSNSNERLAVKVKGRGIDKTGQSFSVSTDNRLVQQTAHNVLRLPTNVTYMLTGRGCALVQVGVKFNKLVEPRDQQQPSFILSANISDSRKCKTQELNICVRYNGVDERSNMAVVAINMISGWIPDKASIYKLKNKAGLGLKRTDIDKNVVQLYFDEFDKTERCWSMNIEQAIEVSDTRSALVHVYDYYQPELAAVVEYNIVSDKCPNIKAVSAQMLRSLVRPSNVAPVIDGGHRRNGTDKPDRKHKQLPCPACSNSSASQQVVCASPNAYRVSVERRSVMKLVSILHTSNANISRSIRNIKYNFHHRCSCFLLDRGNRVIVLTPGGGNNGLQVDAKNARRFSLSLRSPNITILPDNADVITCN